MGRYVDNYIAFRILKLLVTPFSDTDAFKLGIIDAKGKELKPISSLHSDTDLNAYTLLHRLVFRIKKIIEKVPIENKKIVSYAAALALIREQLIINKEPIDLEKIFINKVNENLLEEMKIVTQLLNERQIFTFKQFKEDAPANAIAATPGISTPDGSTLFKKPVLKRKKNV
jgi:hypothetical protein